MQGELILLLSFCFLELFPPQSGLPLPVPCSVPAISWPVLPENIPFSHLTQLPWVFKLASGEKEGLRIAEAEGIGKKVEKSVVKE